MGAVQQATVGSRFTRVQRVELALDFRQPIIRGDFQRWVTMDREFIEQVLRPPVSVRKVRALVRRQSLQPGLNL